MIHNCAGLSCPCRGDVTILQALLGHAIAVTLFVRCMPSPELGKWLQLFLATQWFVSNSVGGGPVGDVDSVGGGLVGNVIIHAFRKEKFESSEKHED